MYIPRREPGSFSREKKNKRKKMVINLLFAMIAGLGIAILTRIFILHPYQIGNYFMAPNFPEGKTVYITPLFSPASLLIGDMVLVRHPLNNSVFLSRIAGKTGDRIKFIDKTMYRNNNLIQNNPGKYLFSDKRAPFPDSFSTRDNMKEIIVKENSWFLLADNRDEGLDSRELGMIPSANLIGKVIF